MEKQPSEPSLARLAEIVRSALLKIWAILDAWVSQSDLSSWTMHYSEVSVHVAKVRLLLSV